MASSTTRGWQSQRRRVGILYETWLPALKIDQHGGVNVQQSQLTELDGNFKLRRTLSLPWPENGARLHWDRVALRSPEVTWKSHDRGGRTTLEPSWPPPQSPWAGADKMLTLTSTGELTPLTKSCEKL